MPLGVDVTTRLAPPARGRPTQTGTLFALGPVAAVKVTGAPIELRSSADLDDAIGTRAVANQALYDYLDTHLREGGARAYVLGYAAAAADPLPGTYTEALPLVPKALGPGQITVVGEPVDAALVTALFGHAQVNNRFAVVDPAVDDDSGARQALGAIARADDNVEYGMVFGRWTTVPAPVGTIGAGSREVPLSAAATALMNRADALGNPNRAAAGRDFPFQYVTGFVGDLSDAELETELNAGVNNAIELDGVLQLFGFQTALAQNEDNPFWQANPSRARMWLKERLRIAGGPYAFKNIDAKGRVLGALKTDAEVECSTLYEADGLFGERPQDAYAVTVTPVAVTATQAELRITVEARWSLHAKSVAIELVSIPITGSVSASA